MPELRIIAGMWRGRRIKVPPAGVRPTADRVRESWMSIVNPHLDGARVLDLCAGSGALGLEALSRGAASCEFVEKDPKVARILAENIATLGAGEVSKVHRHGAVPFLSDLTSHISHLPLFDVALADPPYRQGLAEALASRWLESPFATIFCIEHEAGLTLPPQPDGSAPDRRVYGDTALTIYRLPD